MNDKLVTPDETLEALRRAEQKYRSIFEHCLEGIFQTTPEGKYISANPALARMYGYDSAEELIAGINKHLKPIPGSLHFHVGKMASSHRPVVDHQVIALRHRFTIPDIRCAITFRCGGVSTLWCRP